MRSNDRSMDAFVSNFEYNVICVLSAHSAYMYACIYLLMKCHAIQFYDYSLRVKIIDRVVNKMKKKMERKNQNNFNGIR